MPQPPSSHDECQVYCSGKECTLKCPRSLVENGAVFEQIDNPTNSQKEEEDNNKSHTSSVIKEKKWDDDGGFKEKKWESQPDPASIPKKQHQVVIDPPGFTLDTNSIIGLIVTIIIIAILIWLVFAILRAFRGGPGGGGGFFFGPNANNNYDGRYATAPAAGTAGVPSTGAQAGLSYYHTGPHNYIGAIILIVIIALVVIPLLTIRR